MEIVLSKVLPSPVVEQIMKFNDQKQKVSWKDITIKEMHMKFISRKPDRFSRGMINYFKITDSIIQSDKFKTFVGDMNYASIWKSDNGDYMIGIGNGDYEFEKNEKYICDLKFIRYSDYRVGGGDGICYKSKLSNIHHEYEEMMDDDFIDDN